jgi:TPR repeat protein
MTTFETRTSTGHVPEARCPAVDGAREQAPRTLAEAIQAVVRSVDARPDTGLAGRPQSLLALLAYCYARGIFGSREIEDTLWRDDGLRELTGREIPAARTLRRFRRDHREAVCHCLKAALKFLSQRAGSSAAHDEAAEARFSEEANGRLMKAMFIDHMELEDGEF